MFITFESKAQRERALAVLARRFPPSRRPQRGLWITKRTNVYDKTPSISVHARSVRLERQVRAIAYSVE